MPNFDTVMSTVGPTTTATLTGALQQQQQQQPDPEREPEHPTPETSPTVATGGNWFDLAIKSEPVDYHHHHLHHHHHHLHSLQQQADTPLSNDQHSSPTSPHSVDSMDSLSGKGGYFESKATAGGLLPGYNPLGFNPLTPPGYSGLLVAPGASQQQTIQQTAIAHQQQQHLARLTTPNRGYAKTEPHPYANPALTPTHTPPMDVTPPKSPKDAIGTPVKEDEHGSDGEDISYDGSEDEEGIRKPKVNSHGQVKKFKCKQCEFIAVTKLNFWEHTRSHIKPEKMLTCTKCPFVTEYKHHLEYHLRNHQRSKPFQCPKCSYSCVNKSMLNSHMKSHSNVFQYRCADCNYATKYCHSLKLHLRKYAHKPDVVLNLDGTPNPLPIIDVYGTRRGPKAKPPKTAEQKLLQKQLKLDEKAKQQQKLKQQHQQQQAPGQAPLTPQSHSQGAAGSAVPPPFTPLSGATQTNGNLMRNLFPHQLFPNPLAHMFKSVASNGSLPLFPYLNLNFQMFADQQAAMAQLSPNFQQQQQQQQQNLLGQLSCEKLNGDLNLNNLNNNNNNHSSGSEDNDLSVKTTSSNGSTTSLGEELLRQITAAAADSSAPAPVNDTPSSFDRCARDSEPETSTGECATPYEAYRTHTIRDPETPQTPSTSGKTERSRRKGRAFKLERLAELSAVVGHSRMDTTTTQYDEEMGAASDASGTGGDPPTVATLSTVVGTNGASVSIGTQMEDDERRPVRSSDQRSLECRYCDIVFRDDVLYTIHMGYHGYDDVFKCNMCGEKSDDRIAFFLHIARKAH